MFSKKPSYKKQVPFLFDRSDGTPFFLNPTLTDKKKKKLADEIVGQDLFPFVENKTERYFISGPSGSGKSTFAAALVRIYAKRFPNNKLFMISSLREDSAFEDLEHLIRVDLGYVGERLADLKKPKQKEEEEEEEEKHREKSEKTEEEIEAEKIEKQKRLYAQLDVEDYRNSLIIFDDVDTLINSDTSKAVLSFRDFLLEQHRHFNIFLVCTTHLIMNYIATRRLLNEAQKIVLFPHAGSDAMITNFIKRYLGWNKTDVQSFFKRDATSRWKLIHKQYPNYVVSSHLTYLIK